MMLHAALRQYRGQSAQESSKLESSRYLMKLVQNYAPTDRKALSPLLLFASITPPVVVGFSLILRGSDSFVCLPTKTVTFHYWLRFSQY